MATAAKFRIDFAIHDLLMNSAGATQPPKPERHRRPLRRLLHEPSAAPTNAAT